MAETQTTPAAPAPPDLTGRALKIVIFGMPNAGKSSLLGSLYQAAEGQQMALGGELVDDSGKLQDLRYQIYDGRPTRTKQDIEAFPVTFRPEPSADKPARPVQVTLYDCAGEAAYELLKKQQSLETNGRNPLPKAVLSADTLVLAIDVSSSPAEINRDFNAFIRFLKVLEQSRGERNEVSGLPVYLVLTKCDLLARPDDSVQAWMETIEDRKRKFDQKFREYLTRHGGDGQPFGGIDLHLWATAIKRPAVGNTPAKPREPYGVAELFRQAIRSAAEYRSRRVAAQRQLNVTVGAAIAVVCVMAVLAVIFFLTKPGTQAALLRGEVTAYFDEYSTPEKVYANAKAVREKMLEFEEKSAFDELGPDLRQKVKATEAKTAAYLEFAAKVEAAQKYGPPENITKPARLDELEKALAEVAVPDEYRDEWIPTEAYRDRKRWLAEVALLRSAADSLAEQYRKLTEQADQVYAFQMKKDFNEAVRKAEKLLEMERTVPDKEQVGGNFIPGSERVTWDRVFEYQPVRDEYARWKSRKAAIQPTLELATMQMN